jgi:transglutaminase-like putative cysteine protease
MNDRRPPAHTVVAAVWLTALFWPYAHTGGFAAPLALAVLPFGLVMVDILPRLGRGPVLVALLLAEIGWQVQAGHPAAVKDAARWLSVLGHALSGPGLGLLLAAMLLGWFIFREARTRDRILLLLLLGLAILTADHLVWRLAVAGSIIVFLAAGLVLLALTHLNEAGDRPAPTPGAAWWGGTMLGILLPILVGAASPALPAHPLGRPPSPPPVGPGSASLTGLPIGNPNINHPVVPLPIPVAVIRGVPSSAYWQAATYTTFNGFQWEGAPGPVHIAPDGMVGRWLAPSVQGFPLTTWRPVLTVEDAALASQVLYTGNPVRVEGAGPLTIVPSAREILAPRALRYRETVTVPHVNPALLDPVPFRRPPPALAPDLTLPAAVSPAVRLLAEQITVGADGPWQAALDLKRYLDAHERYTYDFRPAPRRDPVDQFLFVTHAGYCDQFATAFVLMARSLGIPARWVVGYVGGTFDPARQSWILRGTDAHSWAELYIPPYGWIPVDPTPGWALAVTLRQPANAGPRTVRQGKTTPIPRPRVRPHPRTRNRLHPAGHTPLTAPLRDKALMGAAVLILIGVAAMLRRRPYRLSAQRAETLRLRRLEHGWRRLLRRHGIAPDNPTATVRDLWRKLPVDVRAEAVPVVTFLEAERYGGRNPAPALREAAEAALRAGTRRHRTHNPAPS